jgi:hypothetical protein
MMETRQIIINVPEKVLLAEKATEADFAREMRIFYFWGDRSRA